MTTLRFLLLTTAGLVGPAVRPALAENAPAGAVPPFSAVQPLLEKYCAGCHNPESKKGGVDLEWFSSENRFMEEPHMVEELEAVVAGSEMPPAKAKAQPTKAERDLLTAWAHGLLKRMENALPDDPGILTSPRINSQEYDYVVQDLTGLPLKMSQYLTADSSAGEGFMNVGAAQPMQVGNFESFLSVGKKLLEHARILPGQPVQWSDAPLPPAGTPPELAKALVTSYENWFDRNLDDQLDQQRDDLKAARIPVMQAYLEAAWQYQHRAALGMPEADFATIADAYPVPLFPSAVEKAWRLVTLDASAAQLRAYLKNPLFVQIAAQFRNLPSPGQGDKTAAMAAIKAIVAWNDERTGWHDEWAHAYDPLEEALEKPESQALRGGRIPQGIYTYRLDLGAMKGKDLFFCVSTLYDGPEGDVCLITDGEFEYADGTRKKMSEAVRGFLTADGRTLPFGYHVNGAQVDSNTIGIPSGGYVKMAVPEGARKLRVTMKTDKANAPDTSIQTLITENPPQSFEGFDSRWVLGDKKNPTKARLAELTEWTGTFNNFVDPKRLVPSLLDEAQRSFLGYEARVSTDPWPNRYLFSLHPRDIVHRAPDSERIKLKSLMAGIDAAARTSGTPLTGLEKEAAALIVPFATKAWRRAPDETEQSGLMGLYRYEAGKGASFEGAVKTPLTAVLASPAFLYRFTLSKGQADPYPISGPELATRLAFVFWASLPDPILLDLAAQGKLQEEAVLREQVKRLVADPRARGFVSQFAGNWLRFAGFDSFSGPDSMEFKEFDDALKTAMHEEVVLFFLDLFQANKPITLALDADYSFLNETLATHYGISGVKGHAMRMVKVPPGQRGGVLGMGAFLTKFSAPLRTSPVKRGVWAYEQVLGINLGEPPPNVPQLSDTPKNEAGLTVSQQLAEHRNNPSCFSCHDKFDPLGVALENFDPIGRWRSDIEGSPVDSRGQFGNGKSLDGFPGLKSYLLSRTDQFAAAFCRKLLAYALGRSILPSDKPLLTDMASALKQAGYAPAPAFELLVTSRQFRFRRDAVNAAPPAPPAAATPD